METVKDLVFLLNKQRECFGCGFFNTSHFDSILLKFTGCLIDNY